MRFFTFFSLDKVSLSGSSAIQKGIHLVTRVEIFTVSTFGKCTNSATYSTISWSPSRPHGIRTRFDLTILDFHVKFYIFTSVRTSFAVIDGRATKSPPFLSPFAAGHGARIPSRPILHYCIHCNDKITLEAKVKAVLNFDGTWAIFLVTRPSQFLINHHSILAIHNVFPVAKTSLAIAITRGFFTSTSSKLGSTPARFGTLTPIFPSTPTCGFFLSTTKSGFVVWALLIYHVVVLIDA